MRDILRDIKISEKALEVNIKYSKLAETAMQNIGQGEHRLSSLKAAKRRRGKEIRCRFLPSQWLPVDMSKASSSTYYTIHCEHLAFHITSSLCIAYASGQPQHPPQLASPWTSSRQWVGGPVNATDTLGPHAEVYLNLPANFINLYGHHNVFLPNTDSPHRG